MNTPPRKLLIVENAISAEQPRDRRDDRDRAAQVQPVGAGPSTAAGVGRSSGIRTAARCPITTRRGDDGDQQGVEHPRQPDEQAADHRGHEEGHAVHGADLAVRPVPGVGRNQQRDQRGQRDRPQVADDHAAHQQQDQRPERRARGVGEARRGRSAGTRESGGVEQQ